MKKCTLMYLPLLLCLAAFIGIANAADYKLGVDDTKILNCTDATTRVDGSALAQEEIASVTCYIDEVDQNSDTPSVTVLMDGGCKPMSVDLTALDPGVWHQYCFTTDTGGRSDGLSASLPFTLLPPDPADPSPPTVTE
jgi:hypothetical protein